MKFLFWTLVGALLLALINWIAYWFGIDIAGVGDPAEVAGGGARGGAARSAGESSDGPAPAHAQGQGQGHGKAGAAVQANAVPRASSHGPH